MTKVILYAILIALLGILQMLLVDYDIKKETLSEK
jgi:hypothetical protein